MANRPRWGTVFCCILLAAALTFSLTMVYSTNAYNKKILNLYERQSMYEKLEELDRIARYSSIYDINEDLLTAGLIEGYLNGIGDSDATYMTAAEVASASSATLLSGIGVNVVTTGAGYLYVYDVIEGGSADISGIEESDQIFRINGSDISALGETAAKALLNGTEGTTVSLDVYRRGESINISAVCQAYSDPNVSYYVDLYSLGYIRITGFDMQTYDLFIKALNNLTTAPISGLIIDLRHTSGGALSVAAQILNRMLPTGDIMLQTLRDGTVEPVFSSDRLEYDLPVAVLTDSKTAGPAELMAAAMSEYGKAVIVGTATKGDGTIKQVFTLSDGSAVSISTGIINTPRGATFNGVGVKPDYSVGLMSGSDYDFYTCSRESDSQMKRAIEILSTQIDASFLVSESPVTEDPTVAR